jgi:hypothetical protein
MFAGLAIAATLRRTAMAIAVELAFRGSGATRENYFQALEEMGTQPEGRHPDSGCLFHWMTEVGGGFRVTDVWKTREEFDRFARETIGPITERLGVPQPQIKFEEVGNFLTAG